MTFEPGETTATALIPTIDNEQHECLKSFALELEIPDESVNLCVIKGSLDTASVNLRDDDS